MKTQFLRLYIANHEEERKQYMSDVLEGLQKPEKEIPEKYLYDEEGSKIYSQMNFSKEYYLANCEKQIFKEKGSQLLSMIGKEKFNIIDLGAGDGQKTKILLSRAVKQGYDFSYIPIDISEESNKTLAQNLKKDLPDLKTTIITSKFQDGITWVAQKKSEKNVFFIIGGTVGNLEKEEAVEYFKWIGTILKKGDMIVLGIDLKKNPVLIQNAYFNNPFEFQFLMNSIARINRDLNGNFNLEKFYPHSFYNPKEGMVRGCLISKETQTVQIENSTFNFEEHEVISVCRSRKWLLSEVEKLMAVAGMKLKGYLEDANCYFREVVFQKC